jgi:NADPH-dependent 2,4-dienoyl-CoA reductase/sulfur reductase-like enzyme
MSRFVIIGNGVTGITCARFVRKQSDMKITIVSSETKYHYSRTALMYVYMGQMRWEDIQPYEDWFWGKNKIDLLYAHVNVIDTDNKRLLLNDGTEVKYDKLLIATGSKVNKYNWPGNDLPGVQGLYGKQDLDLLEENTRFVKHAVIVGAGLIGVELMEMLHTRNIPVTFLCRESHYWRSRLPEEECIVIGRHIARYGIELKFNTELKEIIAGENGRVRAVITDNGEEIPCGFVGLTPGVHPNIDVVKESKVETGRGVLVNEYLETNIPDVYSAGDCAEIKRQDENGKNVVEQLWYTGKMQGRVAADTICGNRRRYDRGIRFNSAKFFDIEYQTYGYVHNNIRDWEDTFFWEHPNGKIFFRVVYNKSDRAVTGFNVLGMRLRQAVCEDWIRNGRTVDYVMDHLTEANFNPEFFEKYELSIVKKFNEQNIKAA